MTIEEKQKAIEALKISVPVRVMTPREFSDYIQTINKVMNWLEKEPRTGHWIDTNNIDAKYKAIYMCSNCRSCYTEMKPINMNFCPNCGSDNREVEE